MVNSTAFDTNPSIGEEDQTTIQICGNQIDTVDDSTKCTDSKSNGELPLNTPTQTDIANESNKKVTETAVEGDNSDGVDKTLCCSVPLEKVQGVLTTIHYPKCDEPNNKITRKWLCLYCERSFASSNLRTKHVERSHSIKKNRRLSSRKQQLNVTPCIYCEKTIDTENPLKELFQHLVNEHSNKYFGCLFCEERFLTNALLADHHAALHPTVEIPKATINIPHFEDNNEEEEISVKLTRSRVKPKLDTEDNSKKLTVRNKTTKLKELRSKKLTVKSSRIALNRRESKRLQALAKITDSQKKKRQKPSDRKQNTANKTESVHDKVKPSSLCVNPYPEFDHFYRVKKITDHSIDNLKISSLTFDDVFDKAFFNRIKCNIEENLLHHIDGKLFKNEESESRISNFEKVSTSQTEIQNSASDNYGCELSLNAVTPMAALSLNSQFGEDFESQIEYGSKPSKKKTQTKTDEVHYKYFTRRKFQASILEHKENRDLSKLDMWTQLVIKKRQQKIIDDKKTAKEILEYTTGDEYRNKLKREEMNRILDRRGPFEDLREEASKKAALDKLNSVSEDSISEESFSEVREVLHEILSKVFAITEEPEEVIKEETHNRNNIKPDLREIPAFLNLRRTLSVPNEDEIDKSDRITLICSSQDTENFELPTNVARGKNELVELSGEWARCRMYICAACGAKLSNMKCLLDHKTIYHQNVWVQHYEFVGNQSELYRHLSIPALGKVGFVEDNLTYKSWKRSDARVCSKCKKKCNTLGELHRHILECGGDWTWILARKKCKYRYGARSRRKRKGLIFNGPAKRKTDSTEKKTYNKHNSPRQRPSDAETIERMLADLPAKRSTRKLNSLYDGVKNKQNDKGLKKVKQKKVKCGKVIYDKSSNVKETTEKTINTALPRKKTQINNKSSNARALRSLSRVLSSRILDTNTKLTVKRKLKALNERRKTRQTAVVEKDKQEDTSQTKESKKVKLENLSNTAPKRTSPRSTKIVRTLKLLSGNTNIKSFFPVKKRDTKNTETKDKQTKSKKKGNETEVNTEEDTDKDVTKLTKSDKLSTLVRSVSMNKKKSIKKRPEDKQIKNNTNEDLTKRKRKLKQSFRNVINRVKKLKIDNPETVQNELKDKPENVKSPFLGEKQQEKEPTVKIVIPSNIEAKENLADISETVHTVIPFSEGNEEDSPVPENIFKLDSNNELSLQAKGEPNFDDPTKIDIKNDTDTLKPISIETSFKPKSVPMISPNMKGKIRKPARGLNDCIAMLTSKLQQKTIEPAPKTNSSNVILPNNLPKVVTDPAPQVAECILKIPTFKTQNDLVEDVALDLSIKPKNKDSTEPPNNNLSVDSWNFNHITSVEKIIDNVVSNKLQEPENFNVVPFNKSIDKTIQNVIDGHLEQKTVQSRTSVDDIIDYVINFNPTNRVASTAPKENDRKVRTSRKFKNVTAKETIINVNDIVTENDDNKMNDTQESQPEITSNQTSLKIDQFNKVNNTGESDTINRNIIDKVDKIPINNEDEPLIMENKTVINDNLFSNLVKHVRNEIQPPKTSSLANEINSCDNGISKSNQNLRNFRKKVTTGKINNDSTSGDENNTISKIIESQDTSSSKEIQNSSIDVRNNNNTKKSLGDDKILENLEDSMSSSNTSFVVSFKTKRKKKKFRFTQRKAKKIYLSEIPIESNSITLAENVLNEKSVPEQKVDNEKPPVDEIVNKDISKSVSLSLCNGLVDQDTKQAEKDTIQQLKPKSMSLIKPAILSIASILNRDNPPTDKAQFDVSANAICNKGDQNDEFESPSKIKVNKGKSKNKTFNFLPLTKADTKLITDTTDLNFTNLNDKQRLEIKNLIPIVENQITIQENKLDESTTDDNSLIEESSDNTEKPELSQLTGKRKLPKRKLKVKSAISTDNEFSDLDPNNKNNLNPDIIQNTAYIHLEKIPSSMEKFCKNNVEINVSSKSRKTRTLRATKSLENISSVFTFDKIKKKKKSLRNIVIADKGLNEFQENLDKTLTKGVDFPTVEENSSQIVSNVEVGNADEIITGNVANEKDVINKIPESGNSFCKSASLDNLNKNFHNNLNDHLLEERREKSTILEIDNTPDTNEIYKQNNDNEYKVDEKVAESFTNKKISNNEDYKILNEIPKISEKIIKSLSTINSECKKIKELNKDDDKKSDDNCNENVIENNTFEDLSINKTETDSDIKNCSITPARRTRSSNSSPTESQAVEVNKLLDTTDFKNPVGSLYDTSSLAYIPRKSKRSKSLKNISALFTSDDSSNISGYTTSTSISPLTVPSESESLPPKSKRGRKPKKMLDVTSNLNVNFKRSTRKSTFLMRNQSLSESEESLNVDNFDSTNTESSANELEFNTNIHKTSSLSNFEEANTDKDATKELRDNIKTPTTLVDDTDGIFEIAKSDITPIKRRRGRKKLKNPLIEDILTVPLTSEDASINCKIPQSVEKQVDSAPVEDYNTNTQRSKNISHSVESIINPKITKENTNLMELKKDEIHEIESTNVLDAVHASKEISLDLDLGENIQNNSILENNNSLEDLEKNKALEESQIKLLEEKIRNAIKRSLVTNLEDKEISPDNSLNNDSIKDQLVEDINKMNNNKEETIENSNANEKDSLNIFINYTDIDTNSNTSNRSLRRKSAVNYSEIDNFKEINEDLELNQNADNVKLDLHEINNDSLNKMEGLIDETMNDDEKVLNENVLESKENTYILKENLTKNTLPVKRRIKLGSKKDTKKLGRKHKSDLDVVSPIDEGVGVISENILTVTNPESTIHQEKDLEKEPPIKIIINKHKARRKPKSIKKVNHKNYNELYEDFALVIKKKHRAPVITFSPPNTFTKEDTYPLEVQTPNELNVDKDLDESVEEMDMELDEIPIESKIIETPKIKIPLIHSENDDEINDDYELPKQDEKIGTGHRKRKSKINKKKIDKNGLISSPNTSIEDLTAKDNCEELALKSSNTENKSLILENSEQPKTFVLDKDDFSSDDFEVDNSFEDSISISGGNTPKQPSEDAEILFNKLIENTEFVKPLLIKKTKVLKKKRSKTKNHDETSESETDELIQDTAKDSLLSTSLETPEPISPLIENLSNKNIEEIEYKHAFLKPKIKINKKSRKRESKDKVKSKTLLNNNIDIIDVLDKEISQIENSITETFKDDYVSNNQKTTIIDDETRKKEIDKLYTFSESEDFELEKPMELPRRIPRKTDNLDTLNGIPTETKKPNTTKKSFRKKTKQSDIDNTLEEKLELNFVGVFKNKNEETTVEDGRKSLRTAKLKALESIHDEALADLINSEIIEEKKPIKEIKVDSDKNRYKKGRKPEKTTNLESLVIDEHPDLSMSTKSNKKQKKNDKLIQLSDSFSFPKEVFDATETPLLEDLVAELDGLEELENSIERELNAEISEQKEKADEEAKKEILENNVLNDDNSELRRSRRGSRKIASYNENDLIDPIIDAIEMKRNAKKKDDRYKKDAEKKLNSEQLFDLLKASNGSSYSSKNSFLNSIDVSTDDTHENFNNMFESILKKNSFLSPKKDESLDTTDNIDGIKIKKCKNIDEVEAISNSQEFVDKLKSESNFCDICNKSFVKLDNLIKHRRTLTHIQKLSEIEAKEAEKSKIISRHEDENSRESVIVPPSLTINNKPELEKDLIIGDILDSQDNMHSPFNTKLADIISDVLNKPGLTNLNEEHVLQNDTKRYKSLGERKSFDSESLLTSESHLTEPTKTILEKQISLLENIIDNQTTHNYIDDISLSSDKVGAPNSPPISKPIAVNRFVKPTHYEEISEDSVNLRNYEDQKLRKTLNRDEELFLECCSLLKSSSEVSSSYSSKKVQDKIIGSSGLKSDTESKMLDKNSLEKNDFNAINDYSDNSRVPTPLGNSYDDDASNSNTISSNWGMDKSSEESRDKAEIVPTTFNFEHITTKCSSKSNLIASKERSLSPVSKSSYRSSIDEISDSSENRKVMTKGARKVFEGLKVSIPTEELNMEEVLNNSPKQKKSDIVSEKCNEEEKLYSPTSKRKSKPVKKAQIGSNLLFKVNKKKLPSPTTVKDDKGLDVYDFEETQDNTDVFTKPNYRTLKIPKDDENESESESFDNIETPPETMKKPKSQENITKKKCMIMGRIFKNAAKSKIEDVDEEIRDIPEIDNDTLVENYVAECKKVISDESLSNEYRPDVDSLEKVDYKSYNKVSKANYDNKKIEIKKKLKHKGRKRTRTNSDCTDDEFNICKITKRKTNRKNAKEEDNCINLEQELKECIGVASRKSQRKCTSGKQNVLVEYWSSDESQFEALLESQIVTEKVKPSSNEIELESSVAKKPNSEKKKKKKNETKLKPQDQSIDNGSSNRRKRAAVNPLYHWSSSSEDEANDLIEVKPLRDGLDDDEDRPVQHGWIVGDSPKKLVTMLAQAKGKKADIDSVKEQGKKRTNPIS